jgi:nickel superoxide dismutase
MKEEPMRTFIESLIRPRRVVHAHCDLPCGVYNPAQARIEAESVHKIQGMIGDPSARKGSDKDDDSRWMPRALLIKEERADLVKHHLWVLWTDYFKPELIEKAGLDQEKLHDLFWRATKEAGESKKASDPAQGQKLLDLIGEIDGVFQASKA